MDCARCERMALSVPGEKLAQGTADATCPLTLAADPVDRRGARPAAQLVAQCAASRPLTRAACAHHSAMPARAPESPGGATHRCPGADSLQMATALHCRARARAPRSAALGSTALDQR